MLVKEAKNETGIWNMTFWTTWCDTNTGIRLDIALVLTKYTPCLALKLTQWNNDCILVKFLRALTGLSDNSNPKLGQIAWAKYTDLCYILQCNEKLETFKILQRQIKTSWHHGPYSVHPFSVTWARDNVLNHNGRHEAHGILNAFSVKKSFLSFQNIFT